MNFNALSHKDFHGIYFNLADFAVENRDGVRLVMAVLLQYNKPSEAGFTRNKTRKLFASFNYGPFASTKG